MDLIRQLEKQWIDHARHRPVQAVMALEQAGLVLGAGTVLAKRGQLDPEADPPGHAADAVRLLTLLSIAYDRPVPPAVLGNISRAARQWERGEDCLAAIHLAFTGLAKLNAPREAARRLFIADGLLAHGVKPRSLLEALDLDARNIGGVRKFDPAEPRVPAGNGIFSGRWLAEMGEYLTNLSSSAVSRLATFVVRYGPRLCYLAILIPTPAGGRYQAGKIPGLPGCYYSWSDDESQLVIIRSEGAYQGVLHTNNRGRPPQSCTA